MDESKRSCADGGASERVYNPREPITIVDSPAAVEESPDMPECNYCGAHISERFERVFADEYGRVFACPGCAANAGIAEAAKKRAKNA